MEESVLVSIGQVQNDQLYTNKAFKNGFDARNILEYSLSDKAAADREAVLAAMAAGTSRSEAVAVYDNDENFSAWVADLKKQLEETQK